MYKIVTSVVLYILQRPRLACINKRLRFQKFLNSQEITPSELQL